MRSFIWLTGFVLLAGCAHAPPSSPPNGASQRPISGVRILENNVAASAPADAELTDSDDSGRAVRLAGLTQTTGTEGQTTREPQQAADPPPQTSTAPNPPDAPMRDPDPMDQDDPVAAADPKQALKLNTVIDSVYDAFPLLEAVLQETEIAAGNQVAALGAFDTKVKAASENGPMGFYETFRSHAGVSQPLYNGGEVFGGYRLGRGSFEPWYKERQTDDGGEFKLGTTVPLLRNRDIDARRAALWRANFDQLIAQPAIRGQLIGFTRDASVTYWKWVAEGRKYFAEREWLRLAETRNQQVKRRVEEGDLDPPELKDNERAIAKRRAKLADQLRKVRQSAVKLSLFLRAADGTPIVPSLEQIPDFPDPDQIDESRLESDIASAIERRPDIEVLRLQQQRLEVDYQEACNMGQPRLDGLLAAKQDVGPAASSKQDKSEFELEAGLYFEVPLQRRKALGKMQAVRAKIAQVAAKERFTMDKVAAGIRAAMVGLLQAEKQLRQARRARQLAEQMAAIERRRFEVGESDLLKVAIREQYALDAIEDEVNALLNYFSAQADYIAELALDRFDVPADPQP